MKDSFDLKYRSSQDAYKGRKRSRSAIPSRNVPENQGSYSDAVRGKGYPDAYNDSYSYGSSYGYGDSYGYGNASGYSDTYGYTDPYDDPSYTYDNGVFMPENPDQKAPYQPGSIGRSQKRFALRKKSVTRNILLWTFEILVVILCAYVTVYFFGQSRTNIGQSMDTTLSGGDTVLLNVLTYQLGSPQRGDIISFKPNGSTTGHSNIKRIIGLPGEKIQIKDGMIYIDGSVYTEQTDYPAMTNPGLAASEITLDDGEYFVLGDNRNNSEDSRFADIGIVKEEYIEGKVWFVLSPAEHRGFMN